MNKEESKGRKEVIYTAIPADKKGTFTSTTGLEIKCCSADEWTEKLLDIEGYKESEDLVKLMKTIANPIRLKILLILLERDWACNCEFEIAFGEHQTLISHHLRNLREANLISSTKKGQWKFYRIEDSARDFLTNFRDLLLASNL